MQTTTQRQHRRRHVRRRRLQVVGLATVAAALGVGAYLLLGTAVSGDAGTARAAASHAPHRTAARSAPTTSTAPPATTTTIPSSQRTMTLIGTISGDISPKSVQVSPGGLLFAQNMMYRHTVTVYNRDDALVKTIPDTVRLSDFGIAGHDGESHGAPVEVAFSPDGRYAYVSNYSMYGAGFGPEGNDDCTADNSIDPSFVYRIDLTTLAIDKVIAVGKVPKYLAVTPDGRYVLVSNWCSYDLSIIDTATNAEVKRIPLGPYPRGIAVDPTSHTAYIAMMGETDIARLDLTTFAVDRIGGVGTAPRHVVLSPDARFLYVTLNGDGDVAKVDLASGSVVARVVTGGRPRSMAISPDGTALYVVNYDSNDTSKVRTADMVVTQTVPTDSHPIGIAFDPATSRVYVACYSGVIQVFADG